jgi:glucose-6-phosphate 1-dehydrogenase
MISSQDSLALVIFGVTGNLVQKYILHALYDMAEKGLLPANMSIVGNARKPMSQKDIEDYLFQVLHSENKHHKHPIKREIFEDLAKRISYIDGHLDDPNFYPKLKDYLNKLSPSGEKTNIIYYLATYPELYQHVFENLKNKGMNDSKNGWVRLMIEKPFGNDYESARQLNALLLEYFSEDQIFRLDHYLGKETLQNILTFRFGNGVFEPILNNQHVDHIQILASEDFGIGTRGGYYDSVGALKDVGQNHQLQMLSFTTMDAPAEFTSEAVTRERFKILKTLIPLPEKVVFGQYDGYTDEENVSINSTTETFYALKTEIRNDRFKGVPIYIRAGKNLTKTVTEIAIFFKKPHFSLFKNMTRGMGTSILIFRIQPNEGIVLRFVAKKPGPGVELENAFMEFCYKYKSDFHTLPDPYERLISDAIRGDQTFFNNADEVEAQWAFIDPLLKAKPKPIIYKSGSWGPKEADQLIEADGRFWMVPSELFCRI